MRILIFGDIPGIPQLLRHIPAEHVVGLVCAVIRPQYHEALFSVAESHHLPLLIQPKADSAEYNSFRSSVKQLAPDLILVNSYSMIVREDILSCARFGGINIHGALLPAYRGCNPTQWAILNGETETGVTMHQMLSGLDEGDIIDQRALPLFFGDTWQTVSTRIAAETDDLIASNLGAILSGCWESRKQDNSKANYWRRRTPEDGIFNWSESVISIYNKIRALLPPLPGAFYLDSTGEKIVMHQQLTPLAVTALKYGSTGKGEMIADSVRLRPVRREDSALLYDSIACCDAATPNAPFHPDSKEGHEASMEATLTARTDLVIFVVEELETETAIGICQLFNIDWRHRSAELQIRLGSEPHRGKGIGTEAIRLLTRFGFDDLNLHRIYLHVFATNEAAWRAYQKCGFVTEGRLREAAYIDGAWVDLVAMGLLKDEDV